MLRSPDTPRYGPGAAEGAVFELLKHVPHPRTALFALSPLGVWVQSHQDYKITVVVETRLLQCSTGQST